MSQQYDDYLQEHRLNVIKAYTWLTVHTPMIFTGLDDTADITHQIVHGHDASKNTPNEYNAYDAYFYGGNKSFGVVMDFKHALLHHIHNNPHHWQYWVLINDDPEDPKQVLAMPLNYIIEMVCDWWSFSWKTGDLRSIFKWYEAHKDHIILHPSSRKSVEYILRSIGEELDKPKKANV